MSRHPYRARAMVLSPPPVANEEGIETGSEDYFSLDNNLSGVQERKRANEMPCDETGPSLRNLIDKEEQKVYGGEMMGEEVVGSDTPTAFRDMYQPPTAAVMRETGSASPVSVYEASPSYANSLNYGDESNLSKSESNLISPGNRKGHYRSVSSLSSFFYDKPDTSSIVDLSHNVVQEHLGKNNDHLMPRIKTLELYRQSAKKSKDPVVLFQYAQYMLQTALMVDAKEGSDASHGEEAANTSLSTYNSSTTISPMKLSLRPGSPFSSGKQDSNLKKSMLKEAFFYLKKLSDKGYVDAQYLLADAYSSGALGKVNNKEAFLLFLFAAKHGHSESAYRTSYCFEVGLGTGRDARKAIEFLKMAALKNHPAAMYKLGIYCFYGRMGLPRDRDTKKDGIKWLSRATNVANELTAAAPFELGKLHYYGYLDIIIPDKNYALELFAQAAALGHVESAALLGQCYEFGEVVNQDSNLSIHYYTQAALGGDPESMLAMCAWYLVGNEPYLYKDDVEAFEWAKRAAICRLPKAEITLASFYQKGIGCAKDNAEAQKWYEKAARDGEIKALSKITNADVAKSIQKLKKWKKAQLLNPDSSVSSRNSDCAIM